MSEDEEDQNTCPLCEEEMDLSDKNFLPCPCGYRVCMWCWHHIRENLNGLCPACRSPYNSDPHVFAAVDRDLVVKKNRERKQKEKVEKRIADRTSAAAAKVAPVSVDRKTLHNFRVVQRNLLYVIGLPIMAANEDLLRKAEYFGQYGKITKVVAHKNQGGTHPTASAYVTFGYKEDAKAAIQALDGYWLEGHPLRASFGTTKYCNNFIKSIPCNNPECVYLHELGDDDDRFTKEEIQAGHTKLSQVPGKDQILVTGAGGPSGTGKRPSSDPVLPPPVFIQESKSASMKMSVERETKESEIVESEHQQQDQVSNESIIIAEKEKDTRQSSHQTEVQDVAELPQTKTVSSPENASEIESKENFQQFDSRHLETQAFNGLTLNAVFPVPVSSLKITVWSVVLRENQNTLGSNPFSQLLFPFSELLNLTLPPVDATAVPNYRIYQDDNKEKGSRKNGENSNLFEVDTNRRETSQPILKSLSSFDNQSSSKIPNGSSNSSFSALRQLFPGVNLAYGTSATQTRSVP